MKISNLSLNSRLYTCNVYMVLGSWNTIDDVNTLVDVGCDPNIFSLIESTNTGLGKNKIDQVIITHSHSDHCALLEKVRKTYKPKVYAFNSHLKGVDEVLKDGDILKIADRTFEVYHLTFHSYDSICLYCQEDALLFSGDTSFPVLTDSKALLIENEFSLGRLFSKPISAIYPGHGLVHQFSAKDFLTLKKLMAIN